MKQILLSNGSAVLVDDADFEWLNRWRWKRHRHGYACRTATGGRLVLMHRQIMNEPDHLEVDHKDRNKLNNQRANLRITTHALNGHNKSKQSNNTSGFKGVSWDRDRRKWRATIKDGSAHRTIGRFDKIEDAIVAYKGEAHRVAGEFACTE